MIYGFADDMSKVDLAAYFKSKAKSGYTPQDIKNVVIPSENFVLQEKPIDADYPYRAIIRKPYIESDHVCEVHLSAKSNKLKVLSSECDSFNGEIHLYAKKVPSEDIIINRIILRYENEIEDHLKNARGKVITLEDSIDYDIQGLTIYGKSEQNGTPTPDNPVEIKSVDNPKVTVSDGGEKTNGVTISQTLRAIPVSSGGNVTIDGQQYIADVLKVNSDGTGSIERRIAYITRKLNSANVITNLGNTVRYEFYPKDIPSVKGTRFKTFRKGEMYVSHTKKTENIGWKTDSEHAYYDTGNYFIWLPKSVSGETEVSVLIPYAEINYQTEQLSKEQVNAILSLKTYKSTTVITNDQNAMMEITYYAIA